jgi:hypothetical protein
MTSLVVRIMCWTLPFYGKCRDTTSEARCRERKKMQVEL